MSTIIVTQQAKQTVNVIKEVNKTVEIYRKGEKGDKGIQGIQGVKGDKGDIGTNIMSVSFVAEDMVFVKDDASTVVLVDAKVDLKGDQGIQGIQGVKGDTGLTGDKGDKGDQGIQGLQGIQGVKGDKGDQGIQGIQGVKGDQGDQGIQGIQGIQGVKGDTGAKGDKGDTGLSGIAIGGTIGQLIAKKSLTDYDTEWVNPVDISGKLDKNTAITGATKTKITYDAKGLVISGADATTADIADSLNKRYVTDANLAVIGNTSNTNTGDQTLSSLGAEAVANKSTSVTTDGTSDVKYPSVKAVKDYADSLVVGLLDYRGGYDASVNTWPVSGGSGTAGAVIKGDMWVISVIGTLGGVAVQAGDSIIANVDTPGQTSINWNTVNSNISYVPEDQANKVTSISGGSTDTQYPTAKLLYDQLALKVGTVTSVAALTLGTTGTDLNSTVANATTAPVITLNVPDASVTARGVITTGTQIIAGQKTFPDWVNATTGIKLGNSPTVGTYEAGKLFFDSANKTASVMVGDGITLQLSQEEVVLCFNDTGSDIANGKLVYITGAVGNNPRIGLAKADLRATSAVVGMTTQIILNGALGLVTSAGICNDLNTLGLTSGQQLYLSDASAGDYTNVQPTGVSVSIKIGRPLIISSTIGSVYVDKTSNNRLQDLDDVVALLPLTGDRLAWNGTQWIPSASSNVVGSASRFYLDITASIADNYTLSITPSAYPETINTKTVLIATSPVFFERFVSGSLGRTSIPAGTWTFNTYGATDSDAGTNEILFRINKRVIVTGVIGTWTGTGATRTFTATTGTPFTGLTTTGLRLTAPLIETPNQTGWITVVNSSTVVTVQVTDIGYVNQTGVALNAIYYYLFSNTTGDITGATPALYITNTIQPEFSGLNLTDRIVVAYFGSSTSDVGTDTMRLYYGGNVNYTNFISPLTTLHNDLAGLNTGDYRHLTSAQFAVATQAATSLVNGYLSLSDWSTFNNKIPYTGAIASVDLGAFNLTGTEIKSTVTGAETVTSSFSSYSPSATYPFANFLIGDKVGDTQGGLMIACGGTDATHNKPAQLILSTNKNVVLAGSKQIYITQGTSTTVFGTYIAGDPSASATSIVFSPGGTEATRLLTSGRMGFGLTVPTAVIHIKAGTATASTAPLKLTSGVLLTVPEEGAIEFLTDAFYATITTGAVRKQFAFTSELTAYIPYTGATGAVNLGAYDLTLQGITIGRGGGLIDGNTVMGYQALYSNVTGVNNVAIGYQALRFVTNGNNTAVGTDALYSLANSQLNVGLGRSAGTWIADGVTANSIAYNCLYLGSQSKALSNGGDNEIVVGALTTGHGSNTVTIGNSSITANYFVGSINGGSFVKSGGTSSQFLKADGTVDSIAYQTALINPVTGTGTVNYIPKFSGATSIVNSLIYDDGTLVGIGYTSDPTSGNKLAVNGNAYVGGGLKATTRSTFKGFSDNIQLVLERTNDSTGSVGLGSSDVNYFHLYDTSTFATPFVIARTGSATFSSSVSATTATLSSATPILQFSQSDNGTPFGINFGASNDSFIKQTAGSGELKYSVGRNSSWGGYMTFYTDTVERMRITSSGNVGIGTTNPSGKLHTYDATSTYTDAFGHSGTFQLGSGAFSVTGAHPRGIGVLINSNDGTGITLPYGGNYEQFGLLSARRNVGNGYSVYGVAGYAYGDNLSIGVRGDAYGGVLAAGLYVGSVTGATDNYGIYIDGGTKNYFSGNVGIGTTAPYAKLDVASTVIYTTPVISQIWSTVGNADYNLRLEQLYSIGGINFNFIQKAATVDYNVLSFYNGNVGIGTTAPAVKLDVVGAGVFSSTVTAAGLVSYDGANTGYITHFGQIIKVGGLGASKLRWDIEPIGTETGSNVGSDYNIYRYDDTGGYLGLSLSINRASGNIILPSLAGTGNRAVYSDSTGVLTNTSSDIRLKKNVEPIAYGLESVMRLNPISYNWIPENLGSQKELGFIAQEVGTIIPELIGINNNGMQSLDYAKITAILVKAVQELNQELVSLKKDLKQTLNIN